MEIQGMAMTFPEW